MKVARYEASPKRLPFAPPLATGLVGGNTAKRPDLTSIKTRCAALAHNDNTATR